jgi:parvulin-like peptidyl-prolyl isomerase
MAGYGLNILLNYVQLEYARQQVAKANRTVTPEDIQRERQLTLERMFTDAEKADYEALFTQFLKQQNISRVEFEMVMETNANLRKLAEPLIQGKITDEALQEAFRQLYGETVQVRHIQLSRPEEIVEAKRRLAAGEPFEKVAREMSTNARTAELGGELPAFSRQNLAYPQNFRDVAFALKEGEVSEAVHAEGFYHLIKLERRFEPKAVKFEDVKESVREDLQERYLQVAIKELRAIYASEVIKVFQVDHPLLKQQYDDRLHQRDQQITERNAIRDEFERQRQDILNRAATQPSTLPAPEVAQPPATR